MRILACLLATACCAMAGEYAVLGSGARLHAERHEVVDGKVMLYADTGTTQLEASQVVRFEQEEYTPPKPEVAAPALAAPAAPADEPGADPKLLATNAARKYGLPPSLVKAVVKAESGFRADAVSPKGAIGLMQLMPATARELGADPKIAAQNVDAGTRYLRDLLVKYDGQAFHALAAYNAGPGAVDKYHGVPPYRETHAYILSILRTWKAEQASD